jgi:hypothetical protein
MVPIFSRKPIWSCLPPTLVIHSALFDLLISMSSHNGIKLPASLHSYLLQLCRQNWWDIHCKWKCVMSSTSRKWFKIAVCGPFRTIASDSAHWKDYFSKPNRFWRSRKWSCGPPDRDSSCTPSRSCRTLWQNAEHFANRCPSHQTVAKTGYKYFVSRYLSCRESECSMENLEISL